MRRFFQMIHFGLDLTGCKICDREDAGTGERCWYWPWPHRMPPHRAFQIAWEFHYTDNMR